MSTNRQIVLFDNWSKGLNTRQKLAEKGFSKLLVNFDCSRNGALEKIRNTLAYTIPVGGAIGTIADFCFFAGNSKIYLVVFGDVGVNPKIQVHDGTSWGTVWDSGNGYMPTTTTGVVFVPSFVGGVSTLRIYPQGPASLVADFKLLRPLLIFEHAAKSVMEKWTWEELSVLSAGEFGYLYGSKTVTIWTNPDDSETWAGCKVTCSCSRQRRADWPPGYVLQPFLKPCIGKNDSTNCDPSYCATCGGVGEGSYVGYRTAFTADFAVGDIVGFDFFIPYGTPSTPTYFKGQWMARVTSIESDTVMYVTDGCRRFISATGAPHIYIQGNPSGLANAMYFIVTASDHTDHGFQSRLYRIRQASLVPSYTSTVAAGLTCLKGLPIAEPGSLINAISTERRQIMDWIPSEVATPGYDGSEYVQYGFSYVRIDGCHSNISKISHGLPARYRFKYQETTGVITTWGPGFTLLISSLYPDPTSGAFEEVRKRIKGCNIWRFGPGDNKWMLLAYIPYIPDKDSLNPVDFSRVFFDSGGSLWQSHSIKYGLSYWTKGILDAGQPLTSSVYDVTGGLEEEDMGKEFLAKTASSQGRKIFIGNIASIVAVDAVTVPSWKDDEIRFSLFDMGENFNRDDYLSVATGDPDLVIKIGFFGRQMIIAKKCQVFIVDILGSSEGVWKQVANFNYGILNANHFTVTPFGPVWISVDGIMYWNGEQLSNLTELVLDDYRTYYASYSATMCIGFDRLTNKVYVTEPAVGNAFVVALETATLTRAITQKASLIRNDTSGRAVKLISGALLYPEAKIGETGSPYGLIGDDAEWESNEIDLVDIAGEGKIYRLYFYVSYKKNTVNAHNVKIGVAFDGGARVESDVATVLCLDEMTTVLELDVWKRGKILTVSFRTNEGVSSEVFDYFRLWKVAASVRAVDVD